MPAFFAPYKTNSRSREVQAQELIWLKVADLLPQITTSFEMATVVPIIDFITAEEREAVLNRHFYLFDPILAANTQQNPQTASLSPPPKPKS